MSMEQKQWNFAAISAGFVIVATNVVCAAAWFMGKLTFEQWLAATGSVNGLVVGWVTRAMTMSGTTP